MALFTSLNYAGCSLARPHDDPDLFLTRLAPLGLKGAMLYCCGVFGGLFKISVSKENIKDNAGAHDL